MNPLHFDYVDAIRGWAVLGVLWVHIVLATHPTQTLFRFGFIGQRGVQLFYVLSGFILPVAIENLRGRDFKWMPGFYIRRLFRIAPMYYVAIAMNLLYQGLAPRYEAPGGLHWTDILVGSLFLNGFRPETINSIAMGGWSVTLEATFYIIFPLMIRYFFGIWRAGFLCILSLILCRSLSIYWSTRYPVDPWNEYFRFFWFPAEFPMFCIGFFTYFVRSYLEKLKQNGQLKSMARRQSLSVFFMIIASFLSYLSFPFSNQTLYLSSSAFPFLILGLDLCPWRFFVNPPLRWLGKISFSVYLLHFFVIRFFEGYENFINVTEFALVVLVGSVTISGVAYHLIEKPMRKLGARVSV